MDDLANRMGISKRTLYEHISSKEELIAEIIDSVFADIKDKHSAIANDQELDLIEKIKKIVCLMPQNSIGINYKKVYEIKKYYPKLFTKIDGHLSGEWGIVFDLLQIAIEQKVIRSVNVNLIRQIILGIYRSLIDDEFLMVNNMTYVEALEEAIDIILSSLEVKEA